jgi:lipopolysaccharide/colanic/teichoic acid biosynthesis glycosyltransferase
VSRAGSRSVSLSPNRRGLGNFYDDRGGYDAFIAPVDEGHDHPDGLVYSILRRLFDLSGALVGLVLLLPLLPFIVAMIKLETPGPVLFRQVRVGRRGRLFYCYKFRSMGLDAEARKDELSHLNEATGAAFKIKDDPRITRVGRFLRRSSLDEFPQLWNVLWGDMAIVGPRPQIPREVADYTPAQALRLIAKPGLTCLWQVSGRSQLDFDEWMELDQEYVRRRGLAFDLGILLRTLPAVIERKGAY